MDIHRCRFIPYPASSINALAFSHTSKLDRPSPQSLRLALGRANGDIEIWNPAKGKWLQESILRGGKDRSVEGIVWTQDLDEESELGKIPGHLRLFSIGYSNAVTEWDLVTGMPLRHSSGGHAEVWSIAVQPRWRKEDGPKSKSNQLIAIGCADGSIVLQSTDDEDLTYVRALRRPSNKKARILSLTFCNRQTIAAGCSDGTIWIYDIRGRAKTTMHLGSGPTKGSTYVWAIKYLADNILVSGDSTGELKFWDLRTFTLTQRLLCHDADVLALAPNFEGNVLFSGGMDRKICVVVKDKHTKRWRAINHQRIHAGHVKAMTSIETKEMSVVVSGGIDASLAISPLKMLGSENTRTLPRLPQLPPLLSAPNDRLLVSWWDREVSFCRITKEILQRVSIQKSATQVVETDPLQRILVQGEENISSVSITSDARYLAIATNTSCKIFTLSNRKNDASLKKIRKQESRSLAIQGAKLISFSPNGQFLLQVTPKNELILYKLPVHTSTKSDYENFEDSIKLKKAERPIESRDALGPYTGNINKITWSTDSTMLACADLSGNIDVWTLANTQANGIVKPADGKVNGYGKDEKNVSEGSDESEDEQAEASSSTSGFTWRLVQNRIPKVSSTPLILSFRPGSTVTNVHDDVAKHATSGDRLVVVTLQHEILEFHALTGKLSGWSKRNPSSELPSAFSRIKDRVMGNIWDVSEQRHRLWLYGSSFLFMLDMNLDLAQAAHHRNLKRKRSFRNTDGRLFYSKKSNSGAGDSAFPLTNFGLADQRKLEESEIESRFTEDSDDEEEDDEDEEEESMWQDQNGASTRTPNKSPFELRRQENDNMIEVGNTSGEDKEKSDLQSLDVNGNTFRENSEGLSYWVTLRYRSILGIAALGQEAQGPAQEKDQDITASHLDLEVALVERPLWDLDLDLPFLS